MDFKKELEESKKLLFHTFDEVKSFERWIEKYLASWVRDHESGHGGTPSSPPPSPITPFNTAGDFEEAAKSSSPNSSLLDQVEALANQGLVSEAETNFAHAIVSGNDPDAFSRYGRFLLRVGRLDQAGKMFEQVLQLAEVAGDQIWQAKALGSLGLIYRTRGDLDRAEEMHQKSLAIEEKLGRQVGLATDYGNLGLIYMDRGELERAEEMHRKALGIDEKLDNQTGIARHCGNLGQIFAARGNLDRARELWMKARDLYSRIGMPHMVKQMQEWIDELPKSVPKSKRATGGGAELKGAAKGRKKANAKAKGTRKKKA